MATPKLITSAYKRVFDPVNGVSPRPDRIIQDIKKVVHACKEIHKVNGVFVPGLAGKRVAGKRHTNTTERTSNNHGGRRKRKEYNPKSDNEQLHPDLIALLDEAQDISAFYKPDDEDTE